jgi:hypothetical protein
LRAPPNAAGCSRFNGIQGVASRILRFVNDPSIALLTDGNPKVIVHQLVK